MKETTHASPTEPQQSTKVTQTKICSLGRHNSVSAFCRTVCVSLLLLLPVVVVVDAQACFQTKVELETAVATYLAATNNNDAASLSLLNTTYGPIRNWCVSAITDFSGLFENAVNFSDPFDGWDMSNAVYLQTMFAEANRFNADVSMWNVSQALVQRNMFYNTRSFNRALGDWDGYKDALST